MFSQIHSIKLPVILSESYNVLPKDRADENILKNLTKFNIFIGPNNSGKSRFIRGLFGTRELLAISFFKKFNEVDEDGIKEIVSEYNKDVNDVFNESKIPFSDYSSLLMPTIYNSKFSIKDQRHVISSFINDLPSKVSAIQNSKEIPQKLIVNLIQILMHVKDYYKIIISGRDAIELKCIPGKNKLAGYNPVSKIYIPSLKGIRTFSETDQKVENDIYQSLTFRDYFTDEYYKEAGGPDPKSIFTGLGLYNEITNHLLGKLQKRELIREYEDFLSTSFFDNQEITLIPSVVSKVLNIKIGAEKEQPIYNLGDGLQTIIIITFPLFKHKDEHLLLFIEEPELFLHPGLQRMLFEALNDDRFSKVQYFIATHSNHFLDFSLDIDDVSIYTCKKIIKSEKKDVEYLPSFEVMNVSRRDKKTLELIGARNSSLFLSNCTIWVEGITDRLYLRHYLKLLFMKDPSKKQYKEDIHYSFFEYGGSNITHFSFLENENEGRDKKINIDSLCGTIFLISDKDKDKDGRHAKLTECLGDRFYCLPCREIENLIAPKIIKQIIMDYEKRDDIELFEYDEYKNEYLGAFIDNALDAKKSRRGKYGIGTGTIREKVVFCHKAIGYIKRFEDLSTEAQELTTKIYEFISKMN